MNKTIDCFIIGHNEMKIEEYVEDIRQMGEDSGAYRDLDLSILRHNGRLYHATGIFNLAAGNTTLPEQSLEPIGEDESFSATISYLGTYLDRRGFTFDYVHSFQAEKQQMAVKLEKENILTIAITTTLYVSVFPIVEIMNFIKAHNRTAAIIIGGPFIFTQFRAAAPETLEFLFNSLAADIYVINSQGESALVKIIHALKNHLPLDKINNIYYKTDHRSAYVSTPHLRENNPISQNMVHWDLFSNRVGEHVNVRTTISCPFSCAFCGFPQHAGQYQLAEIAAVENELKLLNKIQSVKKIHFIDDTINVPQKRFKNFLRMLIKNKFRFTWHSQLRCQFLDEETAALMKESGCEGVFLGLEAGNDRILTNMKKNVTAAEYVEGISLLKQYGIITYGSFIIGFPGETLETVRDTVQLIKETKIDFYRTQLWYCDPITPIWKERQKFHISGSNFQWRHATMDSKEAADLIENIFLSVKESIWLPQYGFDFTRLFHLLTRGISWKQIKNFIRFFNEGIKKKLLNPSTTQTDVSPEIMNCIKDIFHPENLQHLASPNDLPGKMEDLTIEFDLAE
ncbi:MAG: PhpK family radical SAM P-methyltransferase [Candidatus Aminicenantes bacterium]|jgi:radical SAM PhpK family P-methyltransferase